MKTIKVKSLGDGNSVRLNKENDYNYRIVIIIGTTIISSKRIRTYEVAKQVFKNHVGN